MAQSDDRSFLVGSRRGILAAFLVAFGVVVFVASISPSKGEFNAGLFFLAVFLFSAAAMIPILKFMHGQARQKQATQDAGLARLATSGFTASRKLLRGALPMVISGPTPALLVDENSEKVCFYSDYLVSEPRLFAFSDLVSSEIVEDGTSVTTTRTSRGSQAVGAVVGNLIAGPLGFVVGGLSGKTVGTTSTKVSKVELKIIVDDTRQPSIVIPFLTSEGSRSGPLYASIRKDAERWHETISVLIRRADMKRTASQAQPVAPAVQAAATGFVADELKKLADLRAAGVLTDEEFAAQKQRVLGNSESAPANGHSLRTTV